MKQQLLLVFLIFIKINFATAQVNFTSSNLPIFVLNTNGAIVDDPKVEGTLGIINNVGQRNYLTDAFNDYNGAIGIELRGQTSQLLFDKKSYSFETKDANGEGLSVSLLGLPEEEDWILYGPFSDKTMIRNVLVYELSNQIGRYASRTKYCELVLNGSYQGVYVLMEKIKRDKNRVDISKLTADELTEPNVSGGYILKLDKYNEYDQNLFYSEFSSDKEILLYQVIYPKDDDLQPAQFDYIQNFMRDFETALKGNRYQDPDVGFRNYIDVNSFVDFLLLNELSRNPDAYRISTYFHKESSNDGGKLKMGPVWDFNIAMGNASFCLGGDYSGWVLNYNQSCPDDYWLIGYWWDRLLTDAEFSRQVAARWQTLRATTFSLQHIHQLIDAKAAEVDEAQVRNYERWDILNTWIWPNNFVGGSYGAEVQYLKDWFGNRVTWIDENIEKISEQVRGQHSQTSFEVYPNPFHETLKVEFQREYNGLATLTFVNFAGQKMASMNIEITNGTKQTLEIPSAILESWSSGVYFYTFEMNGQIINSGKLMKF